MNEIEVSVIIVCRNESGYVADCIRSVRKQFVGSRKWELIVVDGMSDDSTRATVTETLKGTDVNFKIIDNPGKTLATGWNLGIKNASGSFIIRPDAHAELSEGYISGALRILNQDPEIGAAGGKLETKARTFTGKIISEALSMRSGVGNSSFRTGAASGYMDTVVYGLYRKEVFLKVGGFNESLVRHQDTEFHHRVLKAGFKLYFDNSISAVYYCRESVKAIIKQMFLIGYYFSSLLKHDSGTSLKPRHLAPLGFWSALLLLAGIGFAIPEIHWMAVGLFLIYLLAITVESFLRFVTSGRISALLAFVVVPMMHLAYAAGSLSGLVLYLTGRTK
jgi:glycosyltransferase involved in cell wall biosynthesis